MSTTPSLLNDTWLQSAADAFLDFAPSLRGPVGVVYHADMDGAVSAAYISASLSRIAPKTELVTHAVATEEYDFSRLRAWAEPKRLKAMFILDLSIADSPETLSSLVAACDGPVWVYDHHRLRSAPPKDVTFWNPTTSSSATSPHLATFMFAYEVARGCGLEFPAELFLLCLFAEGVDHAFSGIAEQVAGPLLPPGDALRERYRRWHRTRMATLVRAAFGGDDRGDEVVALLAKLALGECSLEQAQRKLELNHGRTADAIRREIERTVAGWTHRIKEAKPEGRLVSVPMEGRSAAGPVASILRGAFPEFVILAWASWRDRIVFELRSKNGGPLDLVQSLTEVATEVTLYNFGGHPSAAGGSLPPDQLDRFQETLSRVLEDQWMLGEAR